MSDESKPRPVHGQAPRNVAVSVTLQIKLEDLAPVRSLLITMETGLQSATQLVDPELIREVATDSAVWQRERDRFLASTRTILETEAVMRTVLGSPPTLGAMVRRLVEEAIQKECPKYGLNWPSADKLS